MVDVGRSLVWVDGIGLPDAPPSITFLPVPVKKREKWREIKGLSVNERERKSVSRVIVEQATGREID